MEFKKLSEVTLVEEVTEAANVLIEEEGEIKRVPKTQVGGKGSGFSGDGIATVVIKQAGLSNFLAGTGELGSSLEPSMTFDEVMEILISGNPVNAIFLGIMDEGLVQANSNVTLIEEDTLTFVVLMGSNTFPFMWMSDGTILMDLPI